MKAIRRCFLFPIALILLLAHSPAHTWAQSPAPIDAVYWFDWSDDGSKIGLAGDGISVYDANFRLLAFRPQPDPTGSRSIASFSPDGTKLATLNEIWDANTLETLVELPPDVILGQWNSDGSQIATIAQNLREIVIYSATTGDLLKTITLDGSQIIESPPMWSHDSTRIALIDRKYITVLIDAIQGQVIARYPQSDQSLGSVIWSPDDTQLAFTGFSVVALGTYGSKPQSSSTDALRDSIYVMDAANGQIVHTITDLPGNVNQLKWSPDSAQLLAKIQYGLVYVWDIQTEQLIDSYKSSGFMVGIEYSPDGGQIMWGIHPYRDFSHVGLDDIVPQSTYTQSLFNGVIKLAVPAPSAARIQNILNRCVTNAETLNNLNRLLATAQYVDFIAAINTLPADQIPPACAADVIAIAEVLNAAPTR
ncbi:MAG TPA: WD40 repeat domain-containing protein [Phototrophicaceae bacterium]|nr:WD40 repeat domain-containing protein [Phototrophicaceae bacterium]